ncbi:MULTISPECIES: carbohydrate ABC transporter permease [Priestia]|jgi:sn-glycerol 3-phosphate transport system permease protein|uniref:Binding--dependent transport system inner membrane component family protein n=1 Tax=Priestia megaterium (strain ATCC 14581 / DSM 32 / CCUG 1817 / JCM 2506 / NBRC 15308 / NCIMB 9376 / NCTC 10342 / NRRL B-14308 / VKM B-512 / Ford 19) TaxID=1348623 RepID=A0A0B6AJX2_PRIM2|nr:MULTISPECIES: sugar ABC transporter permease [Priestia]AJI23826.1 binding--dependent transport system inner membrane component family protein [Priestia megaterium NBRC 15308 = ATCC 14581]AYE53024.1 sugar ABC transporter permease [Priestia megaterium NCT-2]KFN08478.1 binding--dependent transport system inner membrane component family protein [Priestia megaterium]KGJ73445.1 glycerol-3-phosphate ABC transporter permease [Priestia megaterium NBRC 15308 = ATCC 14581]MBY0091482.1 sugar ABC transp
MSAVTKTANSPVSVLANPKEKKSMPTIIVGLAYLLPSLLLFSVFLFYPMIKTLYLSLFITDTQGNPLNFVGLQNFLYLFTDPNFLQSMKATFLFVLYTVPIGLVIALFLALIANEKLKGIGFFRTMFSSTMGMSVAASSVIWMFMYNPTIGVINKVLNLVGIHDVQWLLDPKYALVAVSISTIWMNIGFTFLILLGGLQNIDEKLYENARIAGVSYWYQLRKITLPMLSPTLFFIITVSFINAFQTFGQIDILTKGGPTDSTNVIVYSIYKDAFVNYNVGSASAQATILFFCILLVTALQFKLGERKVHYQ